MTSPRSILYAAFARIGVAVAASVVATGCASGLGHVSKSNRLPPTMVFRSGSTVAVALSDSAAVTHCDARSNQLGSYGSGAVDGMRSFVQSARGGTGEEAIIIVALLPIAAAWGAIEDGGRVVPPAEMAQMTGVLERALQASSSPREIRHCFMEVVDQRTALNFVREELPRAAGVSTPEWRLELAVTELRLEQAAASSGCALAMAAEARWIRVDDGATVHTASFHYRSGSSRPIDWAANEGVGVRRGAEYGYRVIAEQIVHEVLGATR